MAPCWWWHPPQPELIGSSSEMLQRSWTPHAPHPLWVMECCSKHTHIPHEQHEHPTGCYRPVATGRWAAQLSRWSRVLPPVGCRARLWRSYRVHRHGRGQISTCRNSNSFQRLQQHDCMTCSCSLDITYLLLPQCLHTQAHFRTCWPGGPWEGGTQLNKTKGNRCYSTPLTNCKARENGKTF